MLVVATWFKINQFLLMSDNDSKIIVEPKRRINHASVNIIKVTDLQNRKLQNKKLTISYLQCNLL
jgi:hypothetical protein